MENRAHHDKLRPEQLSSTAIWLGALVMALSQLGEHVEPLIAAWGVAGSRSFRGADADQGLAGRAVHSAGGFQVRIGDSVTINGIGGAVEEMNLRTTVLREKMGRCTTIAKRVHHHACEHARPRLLLTMCSRPPVRATAPDGWTGALAIVTGGKAAKIAQEESRTRSFHYRSDPRVMGVDRWVTAGRR